MSRITAPIAKLSRALSSSSAAARAANPLLVDSAATYNASAGAVLMPKYAELLRNRRTTTTTTIEHSESTRSLSTTHRPTPQPSIANRPKPLMQTFSTITSTSSSTPSAHLDAAILPSFSFTSSSSSSSSDDFLPRMPLLPDNYATAHPAPAADPPVSIASSSIVAVNPDAVVPATPLSSLSGVLDTVELKFVHEPEPAKEGVDAESGSQGMIRDLWKGMVEDVFGGGAGQGLRKSN